VTLLRRIRQCLYEDGYTIKGVQRLLREGQLRPEDAPTAQETEAPAAGTEADDARDPRRELQEIRAELERLRDLLRKAGG